MPLLLGIDTGGTYTDAVVFDEQNGVLAASKALTTQYDLAVGISGAVDDVLNQSGVDAADVSLVSLSTTLATNALVEGQGGRAALVLIGFGEQALKRAALAEALGDSPCIVVNGGHDAHGKEILEFDKSALARAVTDLGDTVDGYAVNSQFAVRNPSHEIAARDLIRGLTGRPVTCGHELSSRLDGPRRALTSILNARLIGLIDHLITSAEGYFQGRGIIAPIMVVRGDGALISAEIAKEKPIETILSGPAASLVGAAYLTDHKDAIVSDIGGTTTDVAVLHNGLPRLDQEGATVGGWRTMVEAVAMRTVGLGGDSEVRTRRQGLGMEIILGPRRVIPLSLTAINHGELVHGMLDRQLKQERASEYDGRIAMQRVRSGVAPSSLRETEQKLLHALADGPVAVDRLIQVRTQLSVLDRLVARGLVAISAFTPSDAAHVAGLYDDWDGKAATKAAKLFGRIRNASGMWLSGDAQAMSQWVIGRLIRTSADVILDAAFSEDGFEDKNLSRSTLAKAALDGHHGVTEVSIGLKAPIIGLGASAKTYYPAVAKMLGTQGEVPEHAGVANAIGAVVGQVRVFAETLISQPSSGLFRVHLLEAEKDFSELEDAVTFANVILHDQAHLRATQAGAGDIKVRLERDDNTVVIEGQSMLIESRLKATASGRPRFGI